MCIWSQIANLLRLRAPDRTDICLIVLIVIRQ
jgi:hypothetical protein